VTFFNPYTDEDVEFTVYLKDFLWKLFMN
jgi:hypothetical protein